MEEQERGFVETGALICGRCVTDPALQAVVEDSASAGDECSYCRTAPAARLDDLLSYMLDALRYEYRSASEECPPYDSGEGGYQAWEYELPDLLFEQMDGEFRSQAIYDDIVTALVPYLEPWFDKNWFALRPHEQILASWHRFAALVARRKAFAIRPRARRSGDPDEPIDPGEMLDVVGEAIAHVPSAYRTLTTRRAIWRARYGRWRSAADLGAPPASPFARAGRMNRPGETFLYGAIEPKTAVVETYRSRRTGPLSIGPFFPLRPLRVLDLTGSGLLVPGIYDVDRHDARTAAMFLHGFAGEIAKPVLRANSPRYLPTQIVTTYVRTELAAKTGIIADGIAFPSSRCRGTNVVLFTDASGCADDGAPMTSKHVLALHRRLVAVLAPSQARRRWRAASRPRKP